MVMKSASAKKMLIATKTQTGMNLRETKPHVIEMFLRNQFESPILVSLF